MTIRPMHLPEVGSEVTWAMCRNPMCDNFGIPFEGEIPEGRKQISDERYFVRVVPAARGRPVGVIACRCCGQRSRLASNRAIRPIVRHFLATSLPFADCSNPDCQNHGANVYEHWPEPGDRQPLYRPLGPHGVRCNRCDAGGPDDGAPSISLGTPRRALDRPQTRKRWQALLKALPAAQSIAATIESLGISYATYHRDLARLGARLGDYHAFRNARLIHPGTPDRKKPVLLHTGVIQLSARVSGQHDRARPLPVIVTVASSRRADFVLAAHPCFLPAALCPDDAALEEDGRRPPLESEWDALQHPFGDDPGTDRLLFEVFDLNTDGYPVRTPYAALAHFLVVQKMLSGFRTIHNTIDAADGLFPGALIAYRDRILVGRPEAGAGAAAARPLRPPRTAEVVLFSHAPPGGRLKTAPTGRPSPTPKKSPDDAWRAAEERFAEQPVPASLEREGLSRSDPRVRAALFRHAFKGAYSKAGGWAWLHHPSDLRGYRDPRTLWLTRTPYKTYARHGRALLDGAGLQPLHRVFNAIRHEVRSARRPLTRTHRTSWAASRPAAVLNELAIYLLLRNYGLRKRPQLPGATIPAEAKGLADQETPDPAEVAWHFRLGVEHARQISRWCRGQSGS